MKMVHNGIEYGDMQLICEAYHLMKATLRLNNEEMSAVRAYVILELVLDFNLIRV